jgi:preprotein translocase subunit SecF
MSLRSALSNTKIDFVRFHKLALVMSIFFMLASAALVLTKGLNLGIDFSGGILIEMRIDDKFEISEVREIISKKVKEVQIQNIGAKDLLVRVSQDGEDQAVVIGDIQKILEKSFDNIEYRKIDYVGPQIGSELIFKGVLALTLSFFFIMVYIWIRFDWQFGVGGIFALVHDAILTLGFYSLTGLEFNLTSIAAILTIIGYSINDSVVIYDRVRENLRRHKGMSLKTMINSSLNSTLSRTVMTAGLTLASILALIFFGGEVLFSFSVAIFFGIAIGTYSSIYISAPMLLYLDPRKKD